MVMLVQPFRTTLEENEGSRNKCACLQQQVILTSFLIEKEKKIVFDVLQSCKYVTQSNFGSI